MGQAATALSSAAQKYCLIVESDTHAQNRLRQVVNIGANAQSYIASTMAEAEDAVSKYQFDLIVLDNALADGRGINFAVSVRRAPTYQTTPIILFNDWKSPFMEQKARMARVTFMLSKVDFHPSHARLVMQPRRFRAGSRRSEHRQFPGSPDPRQVANPASPPEANAGTHPH